jgi:glycosyltransferase involved in cell wall biosynthesis
MKPKITVISVTYNDVNCISDTIDSIVKQRTERPDIHLEYIIVDGASTDGTVEIINKRSTEIDRWISEEDNGIYDAMNKGLEMVKDGYIIYLGAGDKIISLPETSLLNKEVKAICGNVITDTSFVFKSNTRRKLKLGNSLHHQSLLIHRSLFPAQAFNTKYKAYADYDLNIRLLKSGVDFIYTDQLVGYQMPGGLTSRLYILEMSDVVRKNFGLVPALIIILYLFTVVLQRRLT